MGKQLKKKIKKFAKTFNISSFEAASLTVIPL